MAATVPSARLRVVYKVMGIPPLRRRASRLQRQARTQDVSELVGGVRVSMQESALEGEGWNMGKVPEGRGI